MKQWYALYVSLYSYVIFHHATTRHNCAILGMFLSFGTDDCFPYCFENPPCCGITGTIRNIRCGVQPENWSVSYDIFQVINSFMLKDLFYFFIDVNQLTWSNSLAPGKSEVECILFKHGLVSEIKHVLLNCHRVNANYYQTTARHNKVQNECIICGIFCIVYPNNYAEVCAWKCFVSHTVYVMTDSVAMRSHCIKTCWMLPRIWYAVWMTKLVMLALTFYDGGDIFLTLPWQPTTWYQVDSEQQLHETSNRFKFHVYNWLTSIIQLTQSVR